MGLDLATPVMSPCGSSVMSKCGVRTAAGTGLFIKLISYVFSSYYGDLGFYRADLRRVQNPLREGERILWEVYDVWYDDGWASYSLPSYLGHDKTYVYVGGNGQQETWVGVYYIHRWNATSGAFVDTLGPFAALDYTYFPRRWGWIASLTGDKSNPALESRGYRFSTHHGNKTLLKWNSTGAVKYWEKEFPPYYYSQFYLTVVDYKEVTYVVTCTQSNNGTYVHNGDGALLWSIPSYMGPTRREDPVYATVDVSRGHLWVAYNHGFDWEPEVVYSRLRCFNLVDGTLLKTGELIAGQFIVAIESTDIGSLFT